MSGEDDICVSFPDFLYHSRTVCQFTATLGNDRVTANVLAVAENG